MQTVDAHYRGHACAEWPTTKEPWWQAQDEKEMVLTKISFKDTQKVQEQMNIATQVALQEALKMPLHVKVLSNVVAHDRLLPSGDAFNITIRVEVHPRVDEKKTE